MDRRLFLGKLITGVGGLLVGDAALDAYERLTHVRKSFPSADVGRDAYEVTYGRDMVIVEVYSAFPMRRQFEPLAFRA